MHIIYDDSELIMYLIIMAIISVAISGYKRFNGPNADDRIYGNAVLLDRASSLIVLMDKTLTLNGRFPKKKWVV